MKDPRYPIGRFAFPETITTSDNETHIGEIAEAPTQLYEAVASLSEEQLDTPYREGGWTVRQVVHHLADSHCNSFLRFKLALTEDEPTIKPYDQVAWAELPDAKSAPILPSLELLDSLHSRWVILLRSLSSDQLRRGFNHPELGPVRVDRNISLYAWHGRHHVAQINSLRQRQGWS